MTYRRDWGKGRCTENRSERGDEPIHVGAVKSRPVCGRLLGWRQPDLGPDSPQRHQESPVHHTLQVSSEPHTHVNEMLLREAREQPEQEQEHAMPHQTSVGVFNPDSPYLDFPF
jgi:hypothetical protein